LPLSAEQGCSGYGVPNSNRSKKFLFQNIQTGTGVHPAPYSGSCQAAHILEVKHLGTVATIRIKLVQSVRVMVATSTPTKCLCDSITLPISVCLAGNNRTHAQ
jgi:hypothetical protein